MPDIESGIAAAAVAPAGGFRIVRRHYSQGLRRFRAQQHVRRLPRGAPGDRPDPQSRRQGIAERHREHVYARSNRTLRTHPFLVCMDDYRTTDFRRGGREPDPSSAVRRAECRQSHPGVQLFMLSNIADEIVPNWSVQQAAAQWCARGVAVQLDVPVAPQIMPFTAVVHAVTSLAALPAAEWTAQRFAGIPPRMTAVRDERDAACSCGFRASNQAAGFCDS